MYQLPKNKSDDTLDNNTQNITTNFNLDIDVNYFIIPLNGIDEDARDTLFRKQILAFFKLDEYKETVIDIKMDILKPIIENNTELKTLSNKFANIMLQEKGDIGIIMFFAFDYFYQTYPLLKQYLLENTINKNIYDNLIKNL